MKDKLTFNSISSLLESLSQFGRWRISLTGGEPFYWKDIDRLLLFLYDLNFPFSITTNGFSSTRIFDKIPSYLWDGGTLYVSIDGDKTTHNNFRGERSFENAMLFLKHVRKGVRKLFVNTVLFTNPSIWAKSLYKELDNIGVDNWTIIAPVKQGRWLHDLDSSNPFIDQYNMIRSIAIGKTTTSFLDFAKTDSLLTDIVFIDSDESVRLPGYFDATKYPLKPISSKININDPDAVHKITISVNAFLASEKYLL